jgi:hypothetical protein
VDPGQVACIVVPEDLHGRPPSPSGGELPGCGLFVGGRKRGQQFVDASYTTLPCRTPGSPTAASTAASDLGARRSKTERHNCR